MGFLQSLLHKMRKGKSQHSDSVESSEKSRHAYAAIFDTVKRNSVHVSLLPAGGETALGGSKVGGTPHVPAGFEWPYYCGEDCDGIKISRPLAFLAQLNLREVRRRDTDHLLPESGMLYFFYEAHTMRWGFDPKDAGSARVFYADESESLAPAEFPADLDEEYRISEQRLSFQCKTELPCYEEYKGATGGYKEYEAACAKYGCARDEGDEYPTKILGYADIIQDEMTEECERVTRGIYCGGTKVELTLAEQEDIKRAAESWILLMQFGTIPNGDDEIMWGDCGCIYYYIRKEDLACKNFDQCWLILQCG